MERFEKGRMRRAIVGRMVSHEWVLVHGLCEQECGLFVREALACLTPREKRVIRQRFGIGTHGRYTAREVGMELGVTSERILQLERRAIKKMRLFVDSLE